MNILEGLNEEQKRAVTHRQGHLLIIAGAGTGKTTVITRRIAWLLSEGLARTNEILALTFTDKAALEMLERVDILVPYGYTDIWVSTFHAFGDRLLRENALVAGLNPDFRVLTRPEAAVFFREHLFEFDLSYYRPLAEPTRFIESMISVFSRAKDEDISPRDYLDYARELNARAVHDNDPALQEEARQQMEIALAYARYQELFASHGVVDFGNQFYLALRLLREHPLVLKSYQEQYKYILVDEFQDTNFAQFQLVKLLAGNAGNITVVADDDQCIYRWRGAAYSNVMNFTETFPQSDRISLIRNYRSTQAILDSAYRLIQNNNPERFEVKAGIDKKLVSADKAKGHSPQHLHFDTNSAEADWVASTIQEKVKTGRFKYRDFAILVRSNSDAKAYLQALNMQAIPWQFSGNQGLYSREEVKLCISFLRAVANQSDSLSLYYLATSEVYSLELSDIGLCMHYARRSNKPLFTVFKSLADIEELAEVKEGSRRKIKEILEDLDKFLRLSRQDTTGRLLYSFLTDTGYLKRLARDMNLEKEAKIQNLAKFFNIVGDFELVAKEDRVINFVGYLDLLIEAGDDPETAENDPNADLVNVLTIHKAKGLEFKTVFMVSLVNTKFPVSARRQSIPLPGSLIKEIIPEGDFHIQEERRLFYVGMTRAERELYFTSALDYGGARTRRVSQFVSESLGGEGKEKGARSRSALEAIRRFAPSRHSAKPVPASLGDGQILPLSFYQIDDYLTCPLKYKYVHILRVPIMEHHTVIYGRAMHEAVTKYFQFKMAGKKIQPGELLEAFRLSFDPRGFISEEHQEERFRIGQEALLRFYSAEEKRGSRPLYIEKDFSFMLDDNKIRGRFDRIDKDEGGAIIMDFKTSELSRQQDADKRSRDSLQLSIYALAYRNIFGELPKLVQLYFLESGLIGSSERDEEGLRKIQDKIRGVAAGIRSRLFEAKPEYMACRYCAYNQICPSASIR